MLSFRWLLGFKRMLFSKTARTHEGMQAEVDSTIIVSSNRHKEKSPEFRALYLHSEDYFLNITTGCN